MTKRKQGKMRKIVASALITRAEAVALINSQLSSGFKPGTPGKKKPSDFDVDVLGAEAADARVNQKAQAWHYGRVELRALIDAIYGPPQSDSEKIETP